MNLSFMIVSTEEVHIIFFLNVEFLFKMNGFKCEGDIHQ